MSETGNFDEAEKHMDAMEGATWLTISKREMRIRISYNHEHMWPQATLQALKSWKAKGESIITKIGHARDILLAEQRLQLATTGVHVVVGAGECSCGLMVEAQRRDGKAVDPLILKAILLNTPGHFDYQTRSFTDLFIAGTTGPSEPVGYWLHKPGELIETVWHCVYCGPLGEATPKLRGAGGFRPHPNPGAHERQWAALNVTAKRWESLKKAELKNAFTTLDKEQA